MQMTTKRAENILDKLHGYVNSAAFGALAKDNPIVSEQIKNVKASDLRFGDCPVFGVAQIEGDLTADGVSYTDARGKKTDMISSRLDDGYIQRYKLACGFTSEPLLFASSENTAIPATCYIIAERLNFKTYHNEKDASNIAQSTAKSVASHELERLDYKMQNFRVNRYNLNYTYGPMPVEIYPVIADLKDKKGKTYPTIIATYAEINVDNGENLEVPEINVNVFELLKKQKLGSKTSKSAKKKKILTAVFATLGALAVTGLLAYFVVSCIG